VNSVAAEAKPSTDKVPVEAPQGNQTKEAEVPLPATSRLEKRNTELMVQTDAQTDTQMDAQMDTHRKQAEPSEAGSGECAVPVTQPPEAQLILRRKTEEVPALRRQARPTSGKGIRKVMTSEPSQDPYRPPAGHMYVLGNTAPNGTRSSYQRTAGLYATRTAWGKWQSLERRIPDVIMQRMTRAEEEGMWQPATEEHELYREVSLLWAVGGIPTSARRGSP